MGIEGVHDGDIVEGLVVIVVEAGAFGDVILHVIEARVDGGEIVLKGRVSLARDGGVAGHGRL